MIISINVKIINCYNINIWKNPIPIHNRNSQQTRSRGEFPQLIKNIYNKHIANIRLNDKKLETFHLRSGGKIHHFHHYAESFSQRNKTRKKNKRYTVGKKENKPQKIKLHLFTIDMFVYVQNLEELTCLSMYKISKN